MNNTLKIISIVLFAIALIDVVETVKTIYRGFKVFVKMRKKENDKEVEMTIPFAIYYDLFVDFLLIGFLVLFWVN